MWPVPTKQPSTGSSRAFLVSAFHIHCPQLAESSVRPRSLSLLFCRLCPRCLFLFADCPCILFAIIHHSCEYRLMLSPERHPLNHQPGVCPGDCWHRVLFITISLLTLHCRRTCNVPLLCSCSLHCCTCISFCLHCCFSSSPPFLTGPLLQTTCLGNFRRSFTLSCTLSSPFNPITTRFNHIFFNELIKGRHYVLFLLYAKQWAACLPNSWSSSGINVSSIALCDTLIFNC